VLERGRHHAEVACCRNSVKRDLKRSWAVSRLTGRGLPDPDAVGEDRLGRGPPLLRRAVVDHEEPRVGRFPEQSDALRVVFPSAVGEFGLERQFGAADHP